MKKVLSFTLAVLMVMSLCISTSVNADVINSNHFVDYAGFNSDESEWEVFGWSVVDTEIVRLGYVLDGEDVVWVVDDVDVRDDNSIIEKNDCFEDLELESIIAGSNMANGLETFFAYRIHITLDTLTMEKGEHMLQVAAEYADGSIGNPFRYSEINFEKTREAQAPVETETEAEPEPTPDEYFTFTLLDNGTYEIKAKDINNLPEKLVIPAAYNGKAVTVIAADAFSESNIKSVVIGKNVVTIQEYAFWKCQKLNSVTLPAGLHVIEAEAFKACDDLTSAVFMAPDGWDKFSSDALSDAYIAAVLLKTESGVLYHHTWSDPVTMTALTCTQNGHYNHICTVCGKYEDYYVYTTGHDIDENYVCKKCGEHFTTTDDSYFDFSRLDDGTYEIKKKDGVNLPSYLILPKTHNGKAITSIGDLAFQECGLTSVTIPDSVTSIGEKAFYNCWNITSVTIPDSVTSIGDYAFCGCESLTSITIPDGVTSIGEGAFSSCRLTSVTIPDNVTSIGDYAFSGCSRLVRVTIPDSVTSIGWGAFYYCSGLTSVTIPDSVTSIGDYAFEHCSSLTSVTIPGTVTSISGPVFYGCSRLVRVTISDGVKSIGHHAFCGCSGLTSLIIPGSVTSIGQYAFSECSNLKTVYYEGSEEQWNHISKYSGNDPLLNAEIVFNCNAAEPEETEPVETDAEETEEETEAYTGEETWYDETEPEETEPEETEEETEAYTGEETWYEETEPEETEPEYTGRWWEGPAANEPEAGAIYSLDRLFVNQNDRPSGDAQFGSAVPDGSDVEIEVGDRIYIIGWAADIENGSQLDKIVYTVNGGKNIDCAGPYRDRPDVVQVFNLDASAGVGAGFGVDSAADGGMLELKGIDKLPDGTYEIAIKAVFKDGRAKVFEGPTGNIGVFTLIVGTGEFAEETWEETEAYTGEETEPEETEEETEAYTGEETEPEEPGEETAEPDDYERIYEYETKTVRINSYGGTVYFEFIPSYSGYYYFYSSSSSAVCGYIYDRNMRQLTSGNTSGYYNNFGIDYYMTAGTTYILGVRYYNYYTTGSFEVGFGEVGAETEPEGEETEPETEEPAESEVEGYEGYIYEGEIKTAHIDYNGEYAYFSFTPTHSDYYIFYSISDSDTYGYIYNRNWSQLASDNDSGSGSNFRIRYYMTAGTTYYLGARYYSYYNTGSFDVCIKVCTHDNANIEYDKNNHWVICEDCGEKIYTKAHTFGEEHVVKEPTCTQNGKAEHTCTFCGYTEQYTIKKLGHEFSRMNQNETQHWTACERCGEKLNVEQHTFGDEHVIKAATCTEKGHAEHSCTVCGYTSEYELEPLGHKPGEINHNEKKHWFICENCGEKLEVEAHTYFETTVLIPATCKNKGEAEHSCSVCGYTEKITLPLINHEAGALEHDEKDHWHECKFCGDILDIEAHTYGEEHVIKPATYDTEGEAEHSCTVCGYTERYKLDKLEPEPVETGPDETGPADTGTEPEGTEPEDTEPGTTETGPDETETEPEGTEPDETGSESTETEPEVTEPEETKPEETEPDETEPQQPEYILGDMNGDGEVNNKDVVVLFRYVSSGEKAEDESIYDYNGDGEVNNKDVVALFRALSSAD